MEESLIYLRRCDPKEEDVLVGDGFVSAYVENPGDYLFAEAVAIATERDMEKTAEFLGSLTA